MSGGSSERRSPRFFEEEGTSPSVETSEGEEQSNMNECGEALALAGAEERRDGGEANGLSEDDFLALAERYTTVPVAHRVQLTQTPMEL